MKSPETIDISELEEAGLVAMDKPKHSPKDLDDKFLAPSSVSQSPKDNVRTKEILKTIAESEKKPENTLFQPKQPASQESVSILGEEVKSINTVPEPKKLSLGEFMENFGSKELERNLNNGVKGYETPKGVALDIYTNQPPTSLKITSGLLIPGIIVTVPVIASLIASAGGISAFIAATSLAAPVLLGVPIIAAGLVAYTGYKMLKSWNAKRAFKNNFGKTIEQTLGHA